MNWVVESNFKLEGIFPVISGGDLMNCILFSSQSFLYFSFILMFDSIPSSSNFFWLTKTMSTENKLFSICAGKNNAEAK